MTEAVNKEEGGGGVEEEGEGEECDGPSLTDIRASAIRVRILFHFEGGDVSIFIIKLPRNVYGFD